ncbi:uncharacterized protein LOC133298324 [Gastrolobium bilobum]|uniref:uncharacterized protein LOC133298324 n=1 Tax=Gastrolobium bilobum TaxID=150636 RepID=UPI002AB2C1F2|nr:uncharacterized protein LOC133298324 [Gastrolobium bilobum]
MSVRDRPTFKEKDSKPAPPRLFFTQEELAMVVPGHTDGLVITGVLVNCRVKRIFIDHGSSADIILWDAFQRMNLDEKDLKPCVTELVGFNGAASPPKGYIDLKLTLGTKDSFRSGRVRFVVVDTSSSYNVIIGRPTIHEWDMLISTKHQALKMPGMNNEIVTIRGDQEESRKCYYETLRVHHGGQLG